MKLAFIGLGVMGFPMAGHLQQAGHDVCVYNRNADKAADWVSRHGGTSAGTPALAAKDADMVMLCVGNDDDVRAVVYGDDGVLAGIKAGALLVDHTTTSAILAEELAVAANKVGARFIDAPVSGGQLGAENGALTVMVGGGEADVAEASPVLAAYGKKVTRLGPVGAGQRCKMVNQICVIGAVQGIAEGLMIAKKAGLDIPILIEVLAGGAAQSWQLQNRAQTMAEGEFDFGFAAQWMHKDLGICLDEAEQQGLTLPLTEHVHKVYETLLADGFGRCDSTVVIKSLES
ncbi:NAD(P)-dependent oxidoreductase [Oceanisphaera arctica]|uniref:2-hydroxy-3-oxopropionate reductase n=1 Tax=Oceanisphaera arctica TaxID=641510 RepID=A0A2P5TQD7_9GAMM|nr:NAD(P)-dependent oxidoreductase [Oceanisphaera arctica]PPL17928.1 2-hydroxy-3-oxopropionate reductase [Oceanisphaera arctica]GHA24097.1 3-hydroxyisobutyrate dehydrogenase [Oceanisphaera arctica]